MVETIKGLRNILSGKKIEVFMGHKNLTYETIERASQRVQIQKSLIQASEATLFYIKGEANLVANILAGFLWRIITIN